MTLDTGAGKMYWTDRPDSGERRIRRANLDGSGMEDLIYTDEPFVSFANVHEAMFEKTVTFNAGSKTFAMTGWRVGYAAGPAPIIKGMTKLQSQETSGTATFIQHALAAALNGDQGCVEAEKEAAHGHDGRVDKRVLGL